MSLQRGLFYERPGGTEKSLNSATVGKSVTKFYFPRMFPKKALINFEICLAANFLKSLQSHFMLKPSSPEMIRCT